MYVAPSFLPTETTDKYIQEWGNTISRTKAEFLYQDSIFILF
jgi:hypothetical protein